MKYLKIIFVVELALLIIFSQSKLTEANSSSPKAIIQIQNLDQLSEFFNANTNKITHTIPFSLNLDGSNSTGEKLSYAWGYPEGKTYNSKNPRSYRFEKAGNYIISLKITDLNGNSNLANIYINALRKSESTKSAKKPPKSFQNGDLSKQIFITEIFPNPKGKDQNQEWIELYNAGTNDVNLGNWEILQTSDENKTSKILLSNELLIEKQRFLVVHTTKALRNSKNTIFLKDFENNEISKIHYSTSKEEQSLSLIPVKNLQTNKAKKTWQWTPPTPKKANKTLYLVEGEILESKANKSNYEIKIDNAKVPNLTYLINTPNLKILEIAFQKNNKIKALAKKESSQFVIMKLEITNKEPKSEIKSKNYYLEILIVIIFLSGLNLIFLKKPKVSPSPSLHCKSSVQFDLWSPH